MNKIKPHTQLLIYIATNKYHYFYSEHYHLSVKLLSSVIKENILLYNLYCNNNPVPYSISIVFKEC